MGPRRLMGGQLIDFGWLNFPPLNSEREKENARARASKRERKRKKERREGERTRRKKRKTGERETETSGAAGLAGSSDGGGRQGDANVTAYVVRRGTM